MFHDIYPAHISPNPSILSSASKKHIFFSILNYIYTCFRNHVDYNGFVNKADDEHMTELPPASEEYLHVSDKVRSGEYFRESVGMYDSMVHDLMAERYFYVLITAIAGLILLIAVYAAQGLYPLERSVPFIVDTQNTIEDVPRITSLIAREGEEPSEALLKYILGNYVTLREEYNINRLDRNVNGVKVQSSEDVFAEFQHSIQPTNPQSPIALYERHSVKKIHVLSVRLLSEGGEYGAEVLYEASVESKSDIKKTRWQANIAFNYSGVTIDQNTGEITRLGFLVTKYENKLLQDLQ
ncbi:MAG: hypothetical protein GC188_09675 [Alphaproteobacteria bacterium]|nr:hypothetical protein [Alphaproteobacteria bacterium]